MAGEFGLPPNSNFLTEATGFIRSFIGIPFDPTAAMSRHAESWVPKPGAEVEDFMADMGPTDRPPEFEIDFTPPDLRPQIERLRAETGRLEQEEGK